MTSHNLLHRVAEEGNLVRTHQRHHFSLLHYISFPANSPTCARRSTRTMNERLGVFRNVVVDNRGYSRNVDSASNRVGRNQNPFLAILKRPHRLVPLTRRQFRGIFCEKRLPRGSAHHQLHEQKHATGEKKGRFRTGGPYRCCCRKQGPSWHRRSSRDQPRGTAPVASEWPPRPDIPRATRKES